MARGSKRIIKNSVLDAEDIRALSEARKEFKGGKTISHESLKKKLDSIAAKSKLTEKDAIEIGRKIKKSMHERYKKEHPGAY